MLLLGNNIRQYSVLVDWSGLVAKKWTGVVSIRTLQYQSQYWVVYSVLGATCMCSRVLDHKLLLAYAPPILYQYIHFSADELISSDLLTWTQLPLAAYCKILLVNYEFTPCIHIYFRLPYHAIDCSWISTKHDCLGIGLSDRPQWNSTITGLDWWTPSWAHPEVAAL